MRQTNLLKVDILARERGQDRLSIHLLALSLPSHLGPVFEVHQPVPDKRRYRKFIHRGGMLLQRLPAAVATGNAAARATRSTSDAIKPHTDKASHHSAVLNAFTQLRTHTHTHGHLSTKQTSWSASSKVW